VNGFVVEKDAVCVFTVSTQALAVIGGDDHRGVFVDLPLLQRAD